MMQIKIGLYFTVWFLLPACYKIYTSHCSAIRSHFFLFLYIYTHVCICIYVCIYKIVGNCSITGATGLKDLTINVPAVVRSGDTVTLSCHYDLEGLSLYTIQWFLEDTEFYRYLFEADPPYTIFEVDGIHVNVSISYLHYIRNFIEIQERRYLEMAINYFLRFLPVI